jgi:hypothetical protein
MLEVDRIQNKKRDPEELEFALISSLNLVDPDPEFVSRLKLRIQKPPSTVLEARIFWEIYVIAASGLFLGALIIWVIQHFTRKIR